jgi:signal transduction histidine kinase
MGSYRTRLQAAFVLLGLIAIGVTGLESSFTATGAIRNATYERLTAIAQTKRRQVERYYHDLGNHVLALSADESTIAALEEFREGWKSIPESSADRGSFDLDPRVRTLHRIFVSGNPHPRGSRHLLLKGPGTGTYGEVHARFHPTLQRYQAAFGFYDTFLINAGDERILYTVIKEADLGMRLSEEPFRNTSLARIFKRAMALNSPEEFVVEDFEHYPPSLNIPAAFFAAPVWRRDIKIGVLAIQVSVDELTRVMTSDGKWSEEGLGNTGEAYIVGPDNLLRSDLRAPARSTSKERTGILRVSVAEEVARSIQGQERGTHAGRDTKGVPVLRSHTPLDLQGLQWTLVAEIASDEALAPVRDIRKKVLFWGIGIALLFFAAASALARAVTRPVLELAESAMRVGRRDFDARIPVRSNDEIGQLAASFNQMAEDLRRTTVSKEELETLTGRLITAQEDERTRIARELHDDLTQRLAAAAIELGRHQHSLPRQSGDLERAKQLLVQLSKDVHELSRRLHPARLDDIGLVAAIESECRSFFERGGPPVEFSAEGEFEMVSRDVQLALYRITQEALRNIQVHSNASDVSVRLRHTGAAVELEISDNGRGFDQSDQRRRRGVGLVSMEERASLLGGICTITSKLEQGTRIRVSIPARAGNEKTESFTGGRSQDRA